MKRIVLFSLFLWSAAACVAQFRYEIDRYRPNIDEEQCQWVWYKFYEERKSLRGYVYVAKDGEPYDLKIRVARTNETPDMWVGIVKKYPDECGLWQWVDDRKKATLVVKFVTKVGEENLIVRFTDGERRRHNTDLPCYDWSSGKPEPCK